MEPTDSNLIKQLLENPQERPFPIENFVSPEKLGSRANRLECICLLATGGELENGEFQEFIQRLKASLLHCPKNREHSSNIHFRVVVSADGDLSGIQELDSFFNTVDVIRSAIPQEMDFYDKNRSNAHRATKYGLKSGPNYIFFETMRALGQFDTTMMLETDCHLGDDWLHRIVNFTENCGGFWISGSRYFGIRTESSLWKHINGGTALYATGHEQFQNFMSFCDSISRKYFEFDPLLAYDCMICRIIFDHYEKDTSQRHIWRFILSRYIQNNLILDCSTEPDKFFDEEKIKGFMNYAVLHKKNLPPRKTFAFIHIPRCGGTNFYQAHLVPGIVLRHRNEFDFFSLNHIDLKDDAGNSSLNVLEGVKNSDAGSRVSSMGLEEFRQRSPGMRILSFKISSSSRPTAEAGFINNLCDGASFLCLLRNPILRYQSEFYHLRDMRGLKDAPQNFDSYLGSKHFLDNWTVRWINGILSPESSVKEGHLNFAIDFLRNCSAIGFLEEYNLFSIHLFRNMGIEMPRIKRILNKNNASKKQPVSDRSKSFFEYACRYDIMLYEYFWNSRRNGVFSG